MKILDALLNLKVKEENHELQNVDNTRSLQKNMKQGGFLMKNGSAEHRLVYGGDG